MTSPTQRNTFSKAEKLCSRKLIDELMAKGKSLNAFPLRMTWMTAALDAPVPVQVLMAVPKRNFKKAVERNRIRRHLREAYRMNKSSIYEVLQEKKQQIALMLVYSGKTVWKHEEAEQQLIKALKKLKKEFELPGKA